MSTEQQTEKKAKRKSTQKKRTDGHLFGPESIEKNVKDPDGAVRTLVLLKLEKAPGTKRYMYSVTPDGERFMALLFGYNSSTEEVAAEMGTCTEVLNNALNAEKTKSARDKGHQMFLNEIRRTQYSIMKRGDGRMAIWLGKQYLGQRDSVEQTVSIKTVDRPEEMTLDQMLTAISAVDSKAKRKDGDKDRVHRRPPSLVQGSP